MSFNQNQTQNIRVLTPEVIGVIKKRQWRDASTILLACTVCGQKRITAPIVAFFKYRGELLACYQCQASQAMVSAPQQTVSDPKPAQPQTWQKHDENMITDRQAGLLRTLIIEKVLNESEREQRLNNLHELTKAEAINAIGHLLKNQI